MTILCFGDSNTFGYDSRSHLGDRYPKEVRWTGLLAACTGWAILEAGQNGREIPHCPWELDDLTHRARQADITVIMLGSNDLLQSPDFQAEDVSLRMEVCLSHLLQTRAPASLLLIAPPPMVPGSWVAGDRLPRESGWPGATRLWLSAWALPSPTPGHGRWSCCRTASTSPPQDTGLLQTASYRYCNRWQYGSSDPARNDQHFRIFTCPLLI